VWLYLDWDNAQLGSAAFWQEGITGKGVTVAVIDTGVDGTHPAFTKPDGSSRVLPGEDLDNRDRDCSGRQWNGQEYTFTNAIDPRDCIGHGTHVAGIVAADGGMAGGPIRGVAPGASILPKKVFRYTLLPNSSIVENNPPWMAGGDVWVRTWAVESGEVLDFEVVWTDPQRPFTLEVQSPADPEQRFLVGEDRLGQPGKILFNVPTERQWGDWTITVTADFAPGDFGRFDYFGAKPYGREGDPDVLAEAIKSARLDGADVINLSLGILWSMDIPQSLRDAVDAAVGANITVIVAAGNSGCNRGCCHPDCEIGECTIALPGNLVSVITVGANDEDGNLARFSSKGPTSDDNKYVKPDVVAPGGQQNTCDPDESWVESDYICSAMSQDILNNWYRYPYAGLTGTSMAAPQVSGLAALLIDYHRQHFGRTLLPMEIKALLQDTAVDKDGNPNTGPKDNEIGAGRVNAARALAAFPSHLIVPPDPEEVTLPVWVPDNRPGESSQMPLKTTACWNDPFYNLILSHDAYGGCEYPGWGVNDKTAWCVQDPPATAGHTFRVHGISNLTPVDVYLASTYSNYWHEPLSVPPKDIADWRVYRIGDVLGGNPVHALVYWTQQDQWGRDIVVNARLFKGSENEHTSWDCHFVLPQVLNCMGTSAAGGDWWIGLQNLSGSSDVPVSIMSSYELQKPVYYEDWSGTPAHFAVALLPKDALEPLGGPDSTLTPLPTPPRASYPLLPTPTPGGPPPPPPPTQGGDQEPPVSAIDPLPAFHNTATFPVSWSGYDTGGSRLRGYDVQWVVLPKTGPWINWLLLTPDESASFTWGQDGLTYGFRCRAVDNAWNTESFPLDPEVVTAVDLTPPDSQVAALPAYSKAQFTVSWSGFDATSGVADYDLQVCQGECPSPQQSTWSDWLLGTTATAASFTGEHGQTYHFRSRARDNAGNEELYPTESDTWTIADAQPPSTTIEPLDLYTFTTSFPVRWHGADDLSGLAHYDIYYRDESQANWVLWLEDVTITQSTFLGSPGHTYHFCSRGVDNVGNAENCPPTCIMGDQCGWPIQGDAQIGIAPWSRVNDLPPNTAQTTFSVCWSGIDEQWYNVYVRDGLYGSWAKWKKNTPSTCGSYSGSFGHVYYFYSVGMNEQVWEEPPYDWDAFTKLVSPTEGEGEAPGGGEGALALLFPDEAPNRREEVTRTQALGAPIVGYIAPAGDVDWYRFELTETMRLRIQLADLPADYDLYVFDGDGRFRWDSTWGQLLPEEVVVRVWAGVYYVRLAGYAGAGDGDTPYRLLVERVTTP